VKEGGLVTFHSIVLGLHEYVRGVGFEEKAFQLEF